MSGVEVLVKWGDRTLERTFVDGNSRRAFSVGEAACDFYAHPKWLGARALDLVTVAGEEATLGFNPRARLEVDGALVASSGDTVSLEPGQVARWALGPLALEARWAVAPKAVVVPLAERVDYLSLNVLMGVAAAMAMGIGAAVVQGVEDGPGDPERSNAVATMAHFVIRPQEKQFSTRRSSDVADPSIPKAPKAEGKSGTKAEVSKPGHAMAGKSNDSDKAHAAFSQLFSGHSLTGITGGTGLGDSLNVALGGMEKASACAGPGCNGMGIKGDGSGGGGLDRDVGSLGLQTHGRAVGDRGYGHGPPLGRMRSVGMPQCLIDPKTGKCEDLGPKIDVTDAVICGAPGGQGLGCLDKELIRKVIRENLAGVRACYERALTTAPSLDGKVSVKFAISTEGYVPTAEVAQSTVNNPVLETCVLGRMRMLKFPRSRGVVMVTYPFIFHTAGK